MTNNPFETNDRPTDEPESIVAGSFVAWRRLLEFDDALYSMRYDLIPLVAGPTLTIPGTQDGSYWIFEISSAVSSGWAAGKYRINLVLVRTSDSEEAELETGSITVFASTEDRRTHAEIMVTKIESVLNGRADHDIESYNIKTRSLTRMSVSELTKWRDYYLDEVARTGGSSDKNNDAPSNTIRVRFI